MSAAWLFAPGTRPERFDKAIGSGAAEVVIDLEDSVPPARKEAARSAVAEWLPGSPRPVWVRVNGIGTGWYAEDLAALADRGSLADRANLAGVVLPKAEPGAPLDALSATLGARRVVALVETAVGVDGARELARHESVARLAFGSLDFAVDIGAEHEDGPLLLARSTLVLASRLGGLPPPVDGVTTSIDDVERITAEARRSRALGFGAKLCIHPAQIPVIDRVFAPTGAEVEWARRVLAAAADGAAVSVDGEMVDKPVLDRARRILASSAVATE